jgi:hypothetical protein
MPHYVSNECQEQRASKGILVLVDVYDIDQIIRRCVRIFCMIFYIYDSGICVTTKSP